MSFASEPCAYFITFTTHGTWLHGDERGSVDPANNIYGAPLLSPSRARTNVDRRYLRNAPVKLDEARRRLVAEAIEQVCRHREWSLHALNVRSNHVHVILTADRPPERVMNDLKSWATRRMREQRVLSPEAKAWTRHGSTRYLWDERGLMAACRYVVEGQGEDL